MTPAHWLLIIHTYAGGIVPIPNLTKEDCAILQQRYSAPKLDSKQEWILTDDGNLCPAKPAPGGSLCTKQTVQFLGDARASECIELQDPTK